MLTLRPAADRGHAHHGWLTSHHSFSFADYYDPEHMGVSVLRVINDDTVDPGAGFATHGHRDMEIISYVLEGALRHQDSMGNGSTIRPGEVQRMSAGRGIQHSEYNDSREAPVKFLQIWVLPRERGGEPGYEQRDFGAELQGRLRLVASPDGREGSLTLHQDALLLAGRLTAGEAVEYALPAGRTAYLHLARGRASVNGTAMNGGDGATLRDEVKVVIRADADAELLLFDLP